MTELEKLVKERTGGSRNTASSDRYLPSTAEEEKNAWTPYADAAKSGVGAQNLYAAVAQTMQSRAAQQTPYADAAARLQGGNAAKGTSAIFNSVYGKADDRTSSVGSGKYGNILKASDYAELSKSGDSKRTIFGDARYDYINNIGNFRAQSDVQQAQGRGQDYGKYAFMTDDEIGVYNYLYATKGKKAANAFLSDLEPELDKQWYTGTNRATTEALGKNAATRTLASAMTVAAQPTRTITSMIAMADDAVRTAKGQEINPYSKWRQASNITQDLRADTSQHIEETNPGLGGKVGSFVYNTAMSAADSAMNALVAKGIGEAVGLTGDTLMKATNILGSALMSSEVASLSIAESKEKGYSNAGALALGLTRGAIEYASEAVGGEWVIRKIKANPLSFVTAMARTMIPEGVEEVMSDAANGVVNLAIDAAFGTEESGIPKMLEYYRTSGTEWQKKHAELATVLAVLGQEGLSFLGGALATIGSSSVQYSTNRANINQVAERLDTTPQNVVQMMQDAQTEDPGVIYALAELTDAENAEDLRQKIGTAEDMKRAAEYLTQQMEAGNGSDEQTDVYTAGTENAPVSAQRAQTAVDQTEVQTANPSVSFAATSPVRGGKGEGGSLNMEGEFGNGQSTYQGQENGSYDLRSGGQAAAEGRAEALTGGRAEIPGGVGADAQANLRQVTPAQLGIRNGGTEAVTVVDAQKLGGDAARAYNLLTANNIEPVAVRGAIQVNNGYANAYVENGKVYFRVDAVDSSGNAISPEALVRHELFHNYISEEVLQASDEVIRESMTAEEYDAMYESYRDAYASIYDFESMSVAEIERMLTEEIAADAYAGLNWFSGDAPVQEAVRTETERNAPAQRTEAQQQRTGPPGRATAAGVNARTADSAALRRAEALERSGTDNETIRQETGWYRGMDGQWRFEIDDSGMEFRRDGDAQLLKEEGYRRLNELTEKWGKAFENGNNLSDAEMQEMERLQEEYKDAVWEEKYNLRDFVKHDELFKAYPALNRVGLVFDSLPDGVNGYFSKRDNTIALSDSLFGKEPDVVLHEIQHVIQRMEGFTGGANPRYWNDRMEEGFSKRWASGEEMMPSELYRNTAGEIEARDTASRRQMTAEERKNTPPNLGDADTVFADGANVSMEIDANSDTEILHLKDQLRAAESRLTAMSPVANIETKGDFQTRLSDRRNKVLQMLNTNKTVDRQNFGKIRLDDGSIRKGIKYVRSAADLAAFEAVPAVMKRGIQINHHEQHKGGKVNSTQNVESWTFAAPVTMNGRRGNLAVVVQKTKDLSYKAHKMLTPDGKAFVLDGPGTKIEAESRPNINEAGNGLRNVTTDSASISSIRSDAGNSQEKSSGRASLGIFRNRTLTNEQIEEQTRYDPEKAWAADSIREEYGPDADLETRKAISQRFEQIDAARTAAEETDQRTRPRNSHEEAKVTLTNQQIEKAIRSDSEKAAAAAQIRQDYMFSGASNLETRDAISWKFEQIDADRAAGRRSQTNTAEESAAPQSAREEQRPVSNNENRTVDNENRTSNNETRAAETRRGDAGANVDLSGINNRTATELQREYERRMREYQNATRRNDPDYPYIAEMKWIQAAERRLAELGDGKRKRRTVGNTKRDIMRLFFTDTANRADVEQMLNRNIGEMMAQGEIREDALDTIVDEMLQAGSVVSNSENSPWIDETHEEIRSDLRGTKLYVSEQTWRDFRKDEARTLREQAREAGITLSKNPNDTAADVRNMELAEKYGEELFPTDISASDMLRNIVDRAAQGVSEKQTLADRLWDEARLEGTGRDQQEAYDRMVGDLRDQTEVILREFAEDNHLTLREQTKQGAKSAEETSEAAAYEEAGTPTKKRDFRPISAVGEYTQQLAKMESTLETENSAVINEGKNRYEARITEEDDSVYAYVYKNGDLIAKARGMNRKKATHWIANQIRSDFGERTVFHPGLEGRGDYNADLEAAKRAEFPVLTKKNGEEVQAVPFWTWVRNKDRGNYGLVVGVGNAIGPDLQNLVEVYYYSKKTGTGKIVPESGLSVYATDGKYSDMYSEEKAAARMNDESAETRRAEEREKLREAQAEGSPFEARPNATTDTTLRRTSNTSMSVKQIFQQLLAKGKAEVTTQTTIDSPSLTTYKIEMTKTNGHMDTAIVRSNGHELQRFVEATKEIAARKAAEYVDVEANKYYSKANAERAARYEAERNAEEDAKTAEFFEQIEPYSVKEVIQGDAEEIADSKVIDEVEKANRSFREQLSEVSSGAMRMFVNAGDTVRRIAKATGNTSLEGYYFNAGAYSQRAGNWIAQGGARTDITGHKTGKSLMDTLAPMRKDPAVYRDFQLYLLHMHNVDRMKYDNSEELKQVRKAIIDMKEMYPQLKEIPHSDMERIAADQSDSLGIGREESRQMMIDALQGKPPRFAGIGDAARVILQLEREQAKLRGQGLKPVFGYDVTAYDSQTAAEMLAAKHPEFKDWAKEVYAYTNELLEYRVQAGMDTRERVEGMKKRYPHYIPTLRVEGTNGKTARKARRNGGIVVSDAVGKAVGSDAVLLPLHTALSRKTVAVMRNAGMNQLGQQLLAAHDEHEEAVKKYIRKVQEHEYSASDESYESDELFQRVNGNQMVVIQNGVRYDITMDEGLTQALNAFQPDKYSNSDVAKALKKGNDLFKALCTGYNPIFMVRNFVRDAQDAAFYSTDSATWAKMFLPAWNQIRTNGEIWQQYKALGGSYSSMLDYATGMVKEPKNAAGKLVAKYESLGQAIEAAPRLAEFMTILANKGGSKTVNGVKTGEFTQSDLMEAMLGAADITTNFARGGTVTKMLNKYLVPFLNPSVQGADKFVRNITDRKGFKAWASLAIKAAALGILPELLNGLMYRDDDEWDDIPDQTKSNYYLFKLGDGYWLKIPRGRALAVFSAGATYAQEKAKGNDPKFSDVIEVVKSNVAPTDIFNQNIATAWTQTKLFNPDNPGTTWYGGNIESQRLQNYRPGERYDEKTDELSKLIGKTFNLSPKKINYLLDQYSGVIGDLLLPWLTPSTTASSPALAPLKQAFMLDSTSTNKTTGEYYDLLDDLKYDANDGDVGAGIARKYVSHAGDEVNDYYQQIRAIQSDQNLTKAEKNRLVRALKTGLIERQKEIIANAETYREKANDYLKAHPELSTDNDAAIAEFARENDISEDQAESRMDAIVYREVNREVFGAEYALMTYNADVYAKASAAYDQGVSYDTYYDYYFATKDMHAEKDENGKSISGSKKAKVVEYINSLDIPPEQKDALYVAAGYTEKSLKSQPWNGGSGSSGRGGGSGKKQTLKVPAPKASEIIIPKSGTASSTKSGGTGRSGGASKSNVIADFTPKASGTAKSSASSIRKSTKKAVDTALKVGNRTVTIKGGSPLDYFLKYGKLPSTK